jgi:indole-3-glycerol phosphate synthase
VPPWDETALLRRRQQNLAAPRPDTRGVTPSIRSFGQAIDRQRQAVEPIPVLDGARPDLVEVALALDAAEVGALAVSLDDPARELPRFAELCSAVSVPVLRTDLVLEEFQVYESRAAGADAVLLHAELFPGDSLARVCSAARGTHMAPCVACASDAEVARAAQAGATVVAIPAALAGSPALPRRSLLVALDGDRAALRGKVDALLDREMGARADPAASFRAALAEET